MKHFQNVKNLVELKKAYRELAKKYHPDVNSGMDTTEIMKEINREYEELGRKLPKSETDTRQADEKDIFDGYREIIEKIIHLDDIVTIEICGTWIWVSGNTFKNKDEIKAAGFQWAAAKKMWYWKPEDWKKVVKKSWSMDQIRNTYGSIQVEKDERKKIESA